MSIEAWLAFVAASAVLLLIPGPTILTVISYSVAHGRKANVPLVAAVALGDSTALVLSLLGLGALLAVSAFWFTVIKLVGGGYLVWLGVKSWRAKTSAVDVRDDSGAAHSSRRFTLFRNGFLVASSNPKAILFAAALLPQFIDANLPVLPQFAVLVSTFAVIEVSWYAVYAGLGARIGEKLKSASVARAFNRLTGGVFVGFGAMMALVRH